MTPFNFWLLLSVLIIGLVYMAEGILLPFFLGALLAYILKPVVSWLESRYIPRTLASLLVVISFSFLFLGTLMYCIPYIYQEIFEFVFDLPSYFKKISDKVTPFLDVMMEKLPEDMKIKLTEGIGNISDMTLRAIISTFTSFLNNSYSVIQLFINLLFIPLVGFYILKDWHRINHNIMRLIPPRHTPEVYQQIELINQTLGHFARGQLMVCFILAVYYSTALSIINMDYAFLIGSITGILSFIPYVGAFIGLVSSLLISFTDTGSWFTLIIIISIFIGAQVLEGVILTPLLVGGNIGLHPLGILFSIFLGGHLFGFFGIILAVPTAAVSIVIIRFLISKYRNSIYYS